MLEHYALEDDPLEAFKQRQSRLEQVSAQVPSQVRDITAVPEAPEGGPWSNLALLWAPSPPRHPSHTPPVPHATCHTWLW